MRKYGTLSTLLPTHATCLLYSIIGEDKTLVIKFGADAGENATEETVLIRGISADVDRAVKEILQIVESAKNDEIINSYVSAFTPSI